ncbi:hypothetical protein FN976_13310 [Caenimonas sedimenti]|uniref:Uncharacterized protein n=1 Tax=Caenimonas sedimenti TaxID=2596921 RepID=A0A562ZQP6_9BURK|nr:hypothetical protein [Caenimonas sedimenti]TWO70930.1 hypothetical protein FN976_13310 [Caenimonas sedimenti]
MDVGSSTIAFIIGFALVAAYVWNRGRWDQKTNEDLEARAAGPDWRGWNNALFELQQRGVPIEAYVPHLARHLVAESAFEREAARMALSEQFPEWQQQLAACGYQSSDSPAVSSPRLQPVFAHFNLPTP